jgi:hypothetical protein
VVAGVESSPLVPFVVDRQPVNHPTSSGSWAWAGAVSSCSWCRLCWCWRRRPRVAVGGRRRRGTLSPSLSCRWPLAPPDPPCEQ